MGLGLSHILWKIKFMFQTTYQIYIYSIWQIYWYMYIIMYIYICIAIHTWSLGHVVFWRCQEEAHTSHILMFPRIVSSLAPRSETWAINDQFIDYFTSSQVLLVIRIIPYSPLSSMICCLYKKKTCIGRTSSPFWLAISV